MGYSADKSPLIGHLAGPIRRLKPLGAQRQEKCGPNHLTREGLHATTPCDVVGSRTLRECRIALGQSQAAFAATLGVSPESYRTWDAGRRATPPKLLARARALATHRDDHELLPLPVLALLIGVHVKTLRSAARDGRLPVTYDTRTTFRRLRARATPAAARAFRRSYYGRPVRPVDRRVPLTWASVPEDYDVQIRSLRRARGLSQAQLATLVGAARKAVIYQWEVRKRTPSPLFWQRLTALLVPAVGPSATGARPQEHLR